ncbi:MAG: type II toxin-antitoxin system VapC family toxin [Ilumatobacteraceae bacterium]
MGAHLILLLDTATLIWSATAPQRISEAAQAALADDDNEAYVSAASAWEIATKYRLGRLPQAQPLVNDWRDQLAVGGYLPVDVTHRHALRAGMYDVGHADPFDRMIAAQAELEDMTLVASDRAFDLFPVTRLW